MEIKLTQKDADEIIIYLRKLLVQEHKRWDDIQEDIKDIKSDENGKKLFELFENFMVDTDQLKRLHEGRVNELIHYIELLTVGSN